MTLHRQKAKKFNPSKHLVPRYAHLKMDGHRYYIDEDGVFSTHEYDITAKVRKYIWYERLVSALEPGHEIEFELVSPKNNAEHVPTALKHGLPLRAYVFASNIFGPSYPIPDMNEHFKSYGLDTPICVNMSEITVEGLLDIARNSKYEGWVLKDGNYENWYKLKVSNAIDLIVVDTKPAKVGSKYDGMVGSLICATTEGHIVCNCSGMTDDKRVEITEAGDDVIGRVVEVNYDRVGNRGRLRFPQFSRWRTDKVESECLVSQDESLQKYWSE